VSDLIARDFRGSQSAAARRIGLSQSHMSALVSGTERGVGVAALLRLREYTGLTLDELLGLGPPPPRAEPEPVPDPLESRIRDLLRAELRRLGVEPR